MASPRNNNASNQLKQNKIDFFGFKKVSPNVHEINVQKQIIIDKERQEKVLLELKLRNEEKQLHLLERAKKLRTERVAINKALEESKKEQELKEVNEINKRTAEEILELEEVRDIFENIEDEVGLVDGKILKRKKGWNARPECWPDISQHHEEFGLKSTLKAYEKELEYIPLFKSRQTTIEGWVKDRRNKRKLKYSHRAPDCGWEVDNELYTEVQNRVLLGLTVDPVTLREMLLVILQKHGKLVTDDAKYGTSWAERFFKRHKLSCRVATTKMREAIPADFTKKESSYINVGAKYIAKYKVPKELVVGIDETNALFVTRATKQRVIKGAKRVRVVGVGHEKSQITVTLGAVEGTGKLLKTQYIFGGKTNRCHPKDNPSEEMGYFTHTESHWQSEISFLEYLEKVVIPWKEETIHSLGLPVDQYSILKIDLHFSHKTEAALQLMRIHHILPLFVPAGCTDIIQECDTVINKPFKNGMKAAFRDHLHRSFSDFRRDNPEKRPSEWCPMLKMSDLKPLMVTFVENGINALKTPEMIATIKTAFEKDGRFGIMRSEDMQLSILADMVLNLNAEVEVNIPADVEGEVDDANPAIPNELSDSDSSDSD